MSRSSVPHDTHRERQLHSVSVLGLGYMGTAIAKAFARKGHQVSVWNRSSGKASALTALEHNVNAYETAGACIQASQLVITVITDSRAFKAIVESLDPTVGSGKTLVNFSTGTPSEVLKSSELTKDKSFDAFIQGAMLAYPAQVGLPETNALYSGPVEYFEPIKESLEVLGKAVYLDDEDPTRAALQEAMIDTAYYTVCAGYLSAMALLKRSGLWKPGLAEPFTREWIVPILQLSEHYLVPIAQQMDSGKYKDENGCRLSNHLSSLRTFVRTYEEFNVESIGLTSFADSIEKRISQGGGDEELSGMVDSL
ncbi:hypothetical protein LTR84_004998 [Exophiala bonariae]|uniref:6-phosphogluconate dehydrogenase NADP-binding domain-containing protein n=1 Tax=Exophiala bonariae TaxID=1690606 RepID=A0AAV9NSF4_9EURO|nr:hypothetical protein LTR84_004998 [Exophiala bonariae]